MVHCFLNWCNASRMAFMKQMWSVRVESNCPQLCLLWEVVHPIRRHCTSSDRVHSDVRGARRRNRCSASRVAFVKTGMECVSDGFRVWSGAQWSPSMLAAPVCASQSYVRKRRSRAA